MIHLLTHSGMAMAWITLVASSAMGNRGCGEDRICGVHGQTSGWRRGIALSMGRYKYMFCCIY